MAGQDNGIPKRQSPARDNGQNLTFVDHQKLEPPNLMAPKLDGNNTDRNSDTGESL